MKSMGASSLPCASAAALAVRALAVVVAGTLIAGCGSPQPRRPRVIDTSAAPTPERITFPASFECENAASTVQDIVCGTESLARTDRQMATVFRQKLRAVDTFGRDQLLAEQNRWLVGRGEACHIAPGRLDAGTTPDPAAVACLRQQYAKRIAALTAWPVPSGKAAGMADPITAYVEFKVAEAADARLCDGLKDAFNSSLQQRGEIDLRRPGFTPLAGLATPGAKDPGYGIATYEAGAYASYAIRAKGIVVGGAQVLDELSLGQWVKRQPNQGGRFTNIPSQTNDYGVAEVFRYGGGVYALLGEQWGFYSAGAPGEWSYAGVYALDGGSPRPVCLYKTYMTPPHVGAMDRLKALGALRQRLAEVHGRPSPELVGNDRRDDGLLRKEQEWMLNNMPLVMVGEARKNGWQEWLRLRHDASLDALFAWSERDLPSKRRYRQVLSLLPAASDELATAYQQQGLRAPDAREAADIAVMELLARAVADLPGAPVRVANAPVAHKPKYPLLASSRDIERGRNYSGLYGAVLNRAPAEVVADYIKYELADPKRRATRGGNGETPLAVAAAVPATVSQLLEAGADANAANAFGKTVLMSAAEEGNVDSVRLLLDAGAKADAVTVAAPAGADGRTETLDPAVAGHNALFYAAAGNPTPALLSLLVSRGLAPDARDAVWQSACDQLRGNKNVAATDRPALEAVICRGL